MTGPVLFFERISGVCSRYFSIGVISRLKSFLEGLVGGFLDDVAVIPESKFDLAVNVLSGRTGLVGFLRLSVVGFGIKNGLRMTDEFLSDFVKLLSLGFIDGSGARGTPWRNSDELDIEVLDFVNGCCDDSCRSLRRTDDPVFNRLVI